MSLEDRLAALQTMSMAQLKSEWRRVHKAAPPACYTADLLTRGIAYKLQEKALGGLPTLLRRELDDLAAAVRKEEQGRGGAAKPRLRPGNTLIRRWRGSTYAVHVMQDGFVFDGRSYASLSVIAREITGTRWSGPRFFGCRA